jgi:2-dehydro-3-deoxygluconokinase
VPEEVTDPKRVAGPARRASHTRVEFVTLGEALAVFIADPPGQLAAASRFQCTVAGAESNVAVGLARLGHRAVFLGKVGADALGEMVMRRLRAENVDVSFVRRDTAKPTGLIIRDSSHVRPSEVAYYRRDSAGAALEPGDVPDEVVAGGRHLHVSGITAVISPGARAAAEHAAAVCRGANGEVSFDPNLRRRLSTVDGARAAFTGLLSLATMIFVSADEAVALAQTPDLPAAEKWFLDRGARLVVTKLGRDGARATDRRQSWTCPAHPVAVADPIGAGDAFAAGFLFSWYRDRECASALRAGAVVAALATTTPADIDGLPTRRDLDAILAGDADARR